MELSPLTIGLWGWVAIFVGMELLLLAYAMAQAVTGWALGIAVEEIGLGAGPAFFSFTIRGVRFRLALLPIGSYTRFRADEHVIDARTGDLVPKATSRSFSRLQSSQKVMLLSVGPLSNLLLAFAVMAGTLMIGRSEPAFLDLKPCVGWCRPGSAMEKAGLASGDEIRVVGFGGSTWPVQRWRDVLSLLARSNRRPLTLQCQRDSRTINIQCVPERNALLDLCHELPPIIGSVKFDSPAAMAGLREGDKVVDITGTRVSHWLDIERLLFPAEKSTPSTTRIVVNLIRQGNEVSLGLQHDQMQAGWSKFGLEPPPPELVCRPEGVRAALARALSEMTDAIDYLQSAVTSRDGPRLWKTEGIPQDNGYTYLVAMMFSAGHTKILLLVSLLGLFLGVINLLPLPILNGGTILFEVIAVVRGKPISVRVQVIAQLLGLIILLCIYCTSCVCLVGSVYCVLS